MGGREGVSVSRAWIFGLYVYVHGLPNATAHERTDEDERVRLVRA